MSSRTTFIFIFLIIAASVFFVAINQNFTPVYVAEPQMSAVKHVKIGDTTVQVDLALTPETRTQGLSGRESLAADQGMLFVFDTPYEYAFWMKDMNFAIDIIWLSTDLKIVDIEKNVEPSSYPGTFAPKKKAKYVLEVNTGFSEKHKLKNGDVVQFVLE